MEILISVLIVVIGIVILIIMNFRNRKKDKLREMGRRLKSHFTKENTQVFMKLEKGIQHH